MPRAARIKYAIEEGGFYHCMNRAAGSPDWYPFAFSDENPHGTACRRKLLSLFKFYSHAYCLSTASLKIMGNHFHIVACAEPYRKMTQEELFERALRFYPNSDKKLRLWDQGDWNWFSHRIFDISEFMRNVEGLFSTWYNETFNRRGSFWADRFKSTLLTDMGAVRDCVLYVDLNAVRAGLVERPEDYEGGSAFFREIGADDWLMTLEDIFFPEEEPGSRSPEEVYEAYKGLLYYRGGAPTKEGQCSIPEEIIEAEEARGFRKRGAYRKRISYFTEGVVIGSKALIRDKIQQLREVGYYLRRRNPIRAGPEPFQHFKLKPQRRS